MGILTRLLRLFKADLHNLMDQLEDKNLLLKQSLLEMEEELHRKKGILGQMTLARDQAAREVEKTKQELAGLEIDLTAAIKINRDDIARRLIQKTKSIKIGLQELNRHLQALDRDLENYRSLVEDQVLTHKSLKLKADIYFREQFTSRQDLFLAPGQDFIHSDPELEVELELGRRKQALRKGA